MADDRTLVCHRCQEVLVARKVDLRYLGHEFYAEIPCCPRCGEIFVPEELAKGRMTEVEMQLEDK